MSDVLVLCYHAISPTWEAPLSVTPEAFEHQVTYLLDRRWTGVTFAEAALAPRHPRTLAITFDDAFASVKQHAAPILERRGIPATVFAPTAFMDGDNPLAWSGIEHWQRSADADELAPMDWNDLRALAELGWEIGSHTHTHPRLTQLDDDRLAIELERSRQICAARVGRPCQTIAYPYGDVDARVAAQARAAGYLAGAGLSAHLVAAGPHRHPRVGLYHGDSALRFWLKITRLSRQLRAAVWPIASSRD